MRRLNLIMLVCALVGMMMCSCASVPRTYEDLNEIPGVDNVYIGPGMMSMAGAITSVAGGKTNAVLALSKNLTSLRVVMVEDGKAIKRVRPFFAKQVKKLKAQPVFNAKKGMGEQFSLYATPSAVKPDTYSDVMMITDSGEYMLVLVATGSFTSEQLRSIK